MAATQIKIEFDENEADNKLGKLHQIKKFGTTTTNANAKEQTKRAALGELGNRALLRTVKDNQKDLKETKCQINLRNAKARVDTHWKKTTQLIGGASNGSAVIGGGAATRKIVTRSNSVKTLGTGIGSAAAGVLKTTSSHILGGHYNQQQLNSNKATTITVKAVKNENKVLNTKLVSKSKPVEKKPEEPTLRREDSNLSRKSLKALKAAISRDSKQSQPNGVSVVKTEMAPTKETAALVSSDPITTTTSTTHSSKCDIKIVSVQSHSSKLLSMVENIDADEDNIFLVSEYVNDIYAYLYNLEVELYIKEDHLKDQKEVHPKMRSVLIDWINEVHHQFHLAPETFQMTVAIIDRYLQAVKNTARQHLQLVGVTALFIAAKYEELYPPPIADFVYITDDTYTKKQILHMEMKIVKALGFNLARPLPIHFLRRFSKAAKADDCIHSLAKYILELASIEYLLASYKPSEIAASALNLSLQLLNSPSNKDGEALWTPTVEFYSRYSPEQLKPLCKKLAAIVRNASHAKLKAVYQKYQSSKLNQISLRPELSGAVIDAIIGNNE